MKLIINTVLVCHVLETSLSYLMYPHRSIDNFVSHNSFARMFDGDFNSDSDDKIWRRSRHYHLTIKNSGSSDSSEEQCSRSRSKCNCNFCLTNQNLCCIKFCQTMCLPYYPLYPQYPTKPEIVVLPYPVPMMVIPPIQSRSPSATDAVPTQNPVITKTTAQTATINATTSAHATTVTTNTTETTLPATKSNVTKSTEPPLRILKVNGNRFKFISHRRTLSTDPPLRILKGNEKRFKFFSHKRADDKKVPEPHSKPVPKFTWVRIPKSLAFSVVKQLKNRRNLLLEERQKLLNLDKRRFITNKKTTNERITNKFKLQN